MPSIIVKDVNETQERDKIKKGMRLLGEKYNEFFEDRNLSPIQVLEHTYNSVLGPPGNPNNQFKAYFLHDGGEYELTYKGRTGDRAKLKFKWSLGGVKRKLKLYPLLDDYDENMQKSYLMRIAMSKSREDLLDDGNYLGVTAQDISELYPASVDEAKQYLLGSITFRRCN